MDMGEGVRGGEGRWCPAALNVLLMYGVWSMEYGLSRGMHIFLLTETDSVS